jgi:hypothetical protein
MQEQCEKVVDPVLSAVKRDCGAILATLHRLDFGKSGPAIGGGGASVYMEELAAKMNFVKQEILERYAGMDVVRQWCVSVVTSHLSHDPSPLCRHISHLGRLTLSG